MQDQVEGIKFNKPHQPSTTYYEAQNGLVRAAITYIYPEESKFATDAWYAPIIMVGAIPVWTGSPCQNAEVALKVAQEHLVEAMTKLLDF